ncbi:MAG TPA: MarP family serine protease [Actinomycetota bacterium]|nr:MarP family serine protease [Actinomycetota bacterium]
MSGLEAELAAERDTADVNGLDVVLVVILVAAVVSGHRRGAALQLFSYGGLLLGLMAGALLAPRVAALVDGSSAQAIAAVAALLVGAAAGDAAGWLVGSRVRRHARGSRLRRADAIGGVLVAAVATLLAIWFVALNLVNGPFPRLSSAVRDSAIVRGLGVALPDPPSVVGEVRRLFDRFGFPEVFEGIPPEPAEPVAGPSRADTQEAVDLAGPSTVKVIGRVCDHVQEGSGFVVADGYVVTNAHVVAGMRAPEVSDADGAGGPATTVFFDPELDLAILRVDGPLGPALPLAPTDVERGAVGAVLGYPGGGALTGTGAAVRQPIPALGHDIYGRVDVQRDVYELQVVVRPGNSGGPFVLEDGTVAGVVFAASSVDPEIGYAIRTSEFEDEIGVATASTTAVDTGPCLR